MENWIPTSENINALPEPVRKYIHDLEARCDPAGEVQELACLRETQTALALQVAELIKENNRLASATQPKPLGIFQFDWKPGLPN